MVSTTAMDARLGSFPARPSFVPLVHELTNWLAGGQVIDLNLRASWIPTLPLPGGGGLSGKYRALEGAGQSARRIDPKIHFEWENGSPGLGMSADRFEVIWTGSLLPPLSGDYVFEVLVDDFFEMTLDGELVYESEGTGGVSRKIPLVAGKPLSFSARYQEEWGEAFVTLKWQRPDGVTELIPSSAFSAVTPEEGDFVLGEGSARDPRGRERGVELLLGRQGKRLEVEGSAIPGEYVVKIPQVIQGEFAGEQEVPLVVLREKEESRLEGWNEDDRNLIRREIDLIELDSMNDVLAALKGQGFGREIWKILALAALVLFFIEGLLARWVSKSRQAGEDVSVDFEKREEMPESFLEAVRSRQASTEMKGGGS